MSAAQKVDLSYPSLAGTVLPIFVVEGEATVGFCGSGFLFAKGIFVTCWHCVKNLTPGRRHVVAALMGDDCSLVDLKNLEQDAAGTDLAIGVVDVQPRLELVIARASYILMGDDVWAFGYPYTDQQPSDTGGYDFTMNGRILRGYVTRTFSYDHPDGQSVDSYELDMPVPSGMSGAPLVLRGGIEVAGVLFGMQDVELVDAQSGPVKRYQTTRVVAFGLAHTAASLRRASTRATNGLPLADFLAK